MKNRLVSRGNRESGQIMGPWTKAGARGTNSEAPWGVPHVGPAWCPIWSELLGGE